YLNAGEFLFDDVKYAVIFAITLAIGLMPEMLATIVSTNLAKGSIDMSKKKVIVKDATSIQNLGAMDVLCSDKTGTLTQNRISVHDCTDIYGNTSSSVEIFTCLNSRNLKSSTNQIDWAIDEYAEEYGFIDKLEQYPYVADVPFDFVRRRATVVVNQDEEVNVLITKGATPEILSISHAYLDKDRNIQPIDEKVKNDIMGLVEWYSEKGMRVLGIGYKYIPTGKTISVDDECELIFTGFVVFSDPVKDTAKTAVQDLRDYGVTTKVLTGDNEYVTRYIGDEIGISTEKIVVGPQIDSMSDEELKQTVEESDIFVRLTPDNKMRIVKALRANGHTVGLMGDGINDVLAMKEADVSISVDTGTDIAKDTASMILLEKDLGILKNGVIEGRKVYVNTIKYVKMIGSINFGYMFSLILATLLFNFNPMGAIMILIFNLINDFACLIIPWDKVEDEFVREPRNWDAINLRNVMFRYGPMCPLTDIMTWAFMVFVIFASLSIDVVDATGEVIFAAGSYGNVADLILAREDLEGTNVEALFQAIWVIEQYWMQVWAIHIVRTNKLPFFQTWSAKILVVTALLALAVGTILPFTGGLWEAISDF
ncbi:MAG: HAD-IC family P-type ATPase, partial [Candidatus Methanomethylophilaceae archaeon]|nr:HAD-IC family P-type ATPase [Candidatus Methanomethylophilaceae archaeon]